VLEYSGIEEILGSALVGREMEEIVSFSLQVKPPAMTDGAVFNFGRKMRQYQVRMNIEYQTRDGFFSSDLRRNPYRTVTQSRRTLGQPIAVPLH
jgi:hypothetical protein